jgi:hypothetical protein
MESGDGSTILWMGMVVHSCNLSTPEAEAGEPQIQWQTGGHNRTLSQKGKNKTKYTL